MITLDRNRLVFRFPEVHEDARCNINFQRTLRIPDDENEYPLPPGLGDFPLRHLDDYAKRVPGKWLRRGGVIMPMHQAEAMWIKFGGSRWADDGYPFAVKIATGKIDAVTGEEWVNHLNRDPQDYVVIPEQPWLDGYCVGKGTIRQFVAMPLGEGYSVEEQINGDAEHGGIQIVVYPMKGNIYEGIKKKRPEFKTMFMHHSLAQLSPCEPPQMDMGLAPGGRMKQEIYDDPHGFDVWDQRHSSRCFVTIANSVGWMATTGEKPPTAPPSASDYTEAGLPWFNYYGADAKAVEGSSVLAKLKSVSEMGEENGEKPLPENDPVEIERIMALRNKESNTVRETVL